MNTSTRLQSRRSFLRGTLATGAAAFTLATFGAPLLKPRIARAQREFDNGFVGRLPNSSFQLGVVHNGRSVLAYACNGTSESHWFRGTIPDGPDAVDKSVLELSSANGGLLRLERESVSLAALEAGATPLATLETSNNASASLALELSDGTAGVFRAQRPLPNGQTALVGWMASNQQSSVPFPNAAFNAAVQRILTGSIEIRSTSSTQVSEVVTTQFLDIATIRFDTLETVSADLGIIEMQKVNLAVLELLSSQ